MLRPTASFDTRRICTDVCAWRDLAFDGAVAGLSTWIAYWLLECFFWSLWPWFTAPRYDYQQTDPWLPLLALIVYSIAGITLGSVAAINLRQAVLGGAKRLVPLVGPLSLATATGILALVNAQYVQLLVAFILTAVISLAFRRVAWAATFMGGTGVLFTPLVLLAIPLVLKQFDYTATSRVVLTLTVISLFLFSYITALLHSRTAPENKTRPSVDFPSLAMWVSLVAIFISLGFSLKQRPIVTGPLHNVAQARRGLPNVVLISLDTVRADHLSLYGYARNTSPNLQRFGQEATVFTNAISAGDMTLSSHASMFTGLYPSQHGAHWILGKANAGFAIGRQFGLCLPEGIPTLAGILSAKGYRTIGIVSNTLYLQHTFRLDQGFWYYSQPNVVLFLQRRELFYLRTNLCRLLGSFCPRSMMDLGFTRAADINREAFQLLQQGDAHKIPFFLFLNYMDAHAPYFPPAPYDSRYPGKDQSFKGFQHSEVVNQALSRVRPYTATDRQRDESQYDGGIAYMDASLGDFFAKLKQLGLYDNSMIIVTSDHGESFGEKKLVGHGTSVYQEQVHVPLIIKYPGPPEEVVRHDVVSHVDLLPTILALLGEQIPRTLPGRNLRAFARFPRTVISEHFPCDNLVSLDPRFRAVERAAFSGSFKLISGTSGNREFYDLLADPQEAHNLYRRDLSAASRIESELGSWVSAQSVKRASRASLGKSEVDRLMSLGYLQ